MNRFAYLQVSSPTCFESRGGAPKPVIVKISSKQPADTIPPIGFNACYQDVVGSPYKCLAFSIIQSCADSSQIAQGAPVTSQPYPGESQALHMCFIVRRRAHLALSAGF